MAYLPWNGSVRGRNGAQWDCLTDHQSERFLSHDLRGHLPDPSERKEHASSTFIPTSREGFFLGPGIIAGTLGLIVDSGRRRSLRSWAELVCPWGELEGRRYFWRFLPNTSNLKWSWTGRMWNTHDLGLRDWRLVCLGLRQFSHVSGFEIFQAHRGFWHKWKSFEMGGVTLLRKAHVSVLSWASTSSHCYRSHPWHCRGKYAGELLL
jgi:hypothetical protein